MNYKRWVFQNIDKQMEFVQNASHELRTPLTIIPAGRTGVTGIPRPWKPRTAKRKWKASRFTAAGRSSAIRFIASGVGRSGLNGLWKRRMPVMTFLWKSGSFTAMCRKHEKYIAYPGAGKLLHRDFWRKNRGKWNLRFC